MAEDNTGCAPAIDPCNYSYPSIYKGTTVGASIDAQLEALACDANDGSYCGVLDICTAEGFLLTAIGNRLGWGREHCSVRPVEFFGLQCATPPPIGTGCLQSSIVGLCDGAYFYCRLDASENYTFTDDELYRSFLKAIAVKNRARRFKELPSVKLAEEIIKELWGDEAWVVSAGNGAIGVSAGRDLTQEEISILSLYEQVVCVGLGIRLEIYCIAPDKISCTQPICPANSFSDACVDGDVINITRGTFTTPIGAIPSLTQTGLPVNITFTDNANGTYTLSGTCDDSGISTYDVTAFIADESCTLSGNVINQSAVAINNPPLADGTAPAPQTITDGDAIADMDFSSCFSDPDGDILTYALVPPVAGLSIDSLTGVVSGTPTGLSAPWPNTLTVRVQASDGNGGSALCSAIITVNEAPAFASSASGGCDNDGALPEPKVWCGVGGVPNANPRVNVGSGLGTEVCSGLVISQLINTIDGLGETIITFASAIPAGLIITITPDIGNPAGAETLDLSAFSGASSASIGGVNGNMHLLLQGDFTVTGNC